MRPSSQPAFDHFPSTEWTWLATRVMEAPNDASIAAELRARIMARYAEPLRIYAKGSSLGWLDDAEALVNGFFASRLARDAYLVKWFESAMPLRRFLANGMLLYLREERRSRVRREARDGASLARAPSCMRSRAERHPSFELKRRGGEGRALRWWSRWRQPPRPWYISHTAGDSSPTMRAPMA